MVLLLLQLLLLSIGITVPAATQFWYHCYCYYSHPPTRNVTQKVYAETDNEPKYPESCGQLLWYYL